MSRSQSHSDSSAGGAPGPDRISAQRPTVQVLEPNRCSSSETSDLSQDGDHDGHRLFLLLLPLFAIIAGFGAWGLYALGYGHGHSAESERARKQWLTAHTLELYQMAHDVTAVFEKHELKYWADGGTALGIARHGGVIPHDDDLDFGVLDKQFRAAVAGGGSTPGGGSGSGGGRDKQNSRSTAEDHSEFMKDLHNAGYELVWMRSEKIWKIWRLNGVDHNLEQTGIVQMHCRDCGDADFFLPTLDVFPYDDETTVKCKELYEGGVKAGI